MFPRGDQVLFLRLHLNEEPAQPVPGANGRITCVSPHLKILTPQGLGTSA